MGKKLRAVTFTRFMEVEVGRRWVVTRCTAKARRLHPGSKLLTKRRYAELKGLYEQETGCAVYNRGGGR